MPKEIAHITLAQMVLESLPPDSIFYKPIQNYFNLFLYGAVAPDTPSYYILGPHNSFIQSLGLKFHTTNNSSLLPILKFIDQLNQPDEDALSFLAGVTTHIMADTTFHPLVYYYAGMDNLHAGATNRHRLFETAMDYYFWGLPQYKGKISLFKLMNHCEIKTKKLCELFHMLFSLQKDKRKRYILQAHKAHLFFQWLFQNPQLYKVFTFLNKYNLGIRECDLSLCYPIKMTETLPFFKNEFQFIDPCRGTVFITNMGEMGNRMVRNTIQILGILEKQFINRIPHNDILNHLDLPEIRPCLSQRNEKFKYWHHQENIDSLLFNTAEKQNSNTRQL